MAGFLLVSRRWHSGHSRQEIRARAAMHLKWPDHVRAPTCFPARRPRLKSDAARPNVSPWRVKLRNKLTGGESRSAAELLGLGHSRTFGLGEGVVMRIARCSVRLSGSPKFYGPRPNAIPGGPAIMQTVFPIPAGLDGQADAVFSKCPAIVNEARAKQQPRGERGLIGRAASPNPCTII